MSRGEARPKGPLPLVRFRRHAGHLRIQEPRRELRGLVRVRGEAVGTNDVPDAFFPGDFHRGASPGGDPEAPRRRHVQPQHPFVPEIPGALVEVVPREGGCHQHPRAVLEVAVSGCRGFVPESRRQWFGVRLRKHPDRESGWSEPESGEVPFAHPLDLPFETQGGDVLQQEVHLARVRGRLRTIAFRDDEPFAVPGHADGGFAGALDRDGLDLGLVEAEGRVSFVASALFALEQRDPAGDHRSRQKCEEGRPSHVTSPA